jgi:anti-sigma-K factor RskA
MTPTPKVQERIRRYLLGQLTDGAREEFEREFLVDEELFEELLVVEDELNDEYLAGELASDERLQFEHHFLAAPERQEKLRFARVLNRYVTARQKETSGGKGSPVSWSSTILYRVAAALAVIVVIAGAFWLVRQRISSPETFATLTLTISDSNRGDGALAVGVKLVDVDSLRIYLRLPDSSTAVRYRVELVNDTGVTRSLPVVQQDAQSVEVVIPAAQLARGQYALRLFGIKADGSEQRINGNYFFTVQ